MSARPPIALVLAVAVAGSGAGGTRAVRAQGGEPRAQTLREAADQPQAVAQGRSRWNHATVDRLARLTTGAAVDAAAVRAADLPLLIDDLERPLALIISGGVSLGSYQAGFLYTYVQFLLAARRFAATARPAWGLAPDAGGAPAPLPDLIAGASSGSINALVAALALCQDPVASPEQSPFYQVWIPVGARDLARGNDGGDGLLSRKPVRDAVDRFKQAWQRPWAPRPCAVDIGLSVNRLRSRRLKPVAGRELRLARQSEKFMLHISAAPGAPPAIAPFRPPAKDPRAALFDMLFPRIGTPKKAATIADVTNLLQASSSFPLAFAPFPLTYTLGDKPREPELFVDGGVFDNTPAGLAVQMQQWRLGEAGEAKSRTRYVVLDPDVLSWPLPEPKRDGAPRPTLADTWFPFAGDFVDSALQADLMNAIAREPTLFAGLELPARTTPVAGAYLQEFLAFLEQDFRTFDFTSGMADAWQHLAGSSLAFQVMNAAGQPPALRSPELDCVLAWRLENAFASGQDPAACAGLAPPARANLLALLYATTAARDRQGGDPRDLDGFLTLLGQPWGAAGHRFVFHDLLFRGHPATTETAQLAIRDTMQDLLSDFARNQNDVVVETVVASLGKAAANYYLYRPPDMFYGFGLLTGGLFEAQLARRLPTGHWRLPAPLELRLAGVFRVADLHDVVLDPGPNALRQASFTYMGALHLINEFQLQGKFPKLQPVLQLELGGGYAAASIQTWQGPLMLRHGPEVVVGAVLYQRVFLDFTTTYYRDDCAWNNACSRADRFERAHLAPIVTSQWGFRAAVGYRFFLE